MIINRNKKLDFYTIGLLNETIENFKIVYGGLLDTVDYVPKRTLNIIYKQIDKELKTSLKAIKYERKIHIKKLKAQDLKNNRGKRL